MSSDNMTGIQGRCCAPTKGIVSGPMNAFEIMRNDCDVWKARAVAAEAKVRDLAAHIRRLEQELGHAPEGSGAV